MYVIKNENLTKLLDKGFIRSIDDTFYWKSQENDRFELIVNPLGNQITNVSNLIVVNFCEEDISNKVEYDIIDEVCSDIIDKIMELKDCGLLIKY